MDQLHSRIRKLRRLQNRTLKDVCDRCGFTVSLLSKIESGKTTPPLATLTKIADALGVKLGDLLEGKHDRHTVLTTEEELGRAEPTRTDKGYAFQLLAAGRSDPAMQPILFTAEKGKITAGAMSHGGEEFIMVLSGRMKYRVGKTTYTLGPGDSLYFDSEEEHDLEPLTKQVRYIGVFAERAAR